MFVLALTIGLLRRGELPGLNGRALRAVAPRTRIFVCCPLVNPEHVQAKLDQRHRAARPARGARRRVGVAVICGRLAVLRLRNRR